MPPHPPLQPHASLYFLHSPYHPLNVSCLFVCLFVGSLSLDSKSCGSREQICLPHRSVPNTAPTHRGGHESESSVGVSEQESLHVRPSDPGWATPYASSVSLTNMETGAQKSPVADLASDGGRMQTRGRPTPRCGLEGLLPHCDWDILSQEQTAFWGGRVSSSPTRQPKRPEKSEFVSWRLTPCQGPLVLLRTQDTRGPRAAFFFQLGEL